VVMIPVVNEMSSDAKFADRKVNVGGRTNFDSFVAVV